MTKRSIGARGNQQTHGGQPKEIQQSSGMQRSIDHNIREHEERIKREEEKMKSLPDGAKNEHNVREHEKRIAREKARMKGLITGSTGGGQNDHNEREHQEREERESMN